MCGSKNGKSGINICWAAIQGESGDVSGDTSYSVLEREITWNFEGDIIIYNLDETGCFWKALPEKGFGEKGKKCRGGRKSKQ